MEQEQTCCHGKKRGKVVLGIVIVLAVAAVATFAILRDAITNRNLYQVSVVGRSKLAYQPDIATVTLGVQVDKAPSAEVALTTLNEKMNKITTVLKALGLGEENIQTQTYTLNPLVEYNNNVSTTTGYSANQQLAIKVKDIKLTSKVIEEASKAGANQVLGVSFDVSNLEELKQQARVAAIADAKTKAGALAGSAGITLGEIVGWWENYVQGPGMPGAGAYYDKGMGGAAMSSPSIPVGNQELIIEMNVNYRIK